MEGKPMIDDRADIILQRPRGIDARMRQAIDTIREKGLEPSFFLMDLIDKREIAQKAAPAQGMQFEDVPVHFRVCTAAGSLLYPKHGNPIPVPRR